MEIAVPATSDDDELTALVGRVRGGNADAFEALANRVRLRIRRWAHRLVRDGDEAEDVAQMVLVRMHERLDEFEGRSRFGSWLYRITRNVALDRRRVEERRHALLERELRSRDMSITTESETDAGDAARIAHLVTSYFSTLPPRQRDVFELIELRGMPTAEGFSLTVAADKDRFRLIGDVVRVEAESGSDAGSVRLRVRLAHVPGSTSHGKDAEATTLLSTGLTVPIGQTVVLGSAAPGGQTRALILTVRPEVAIPSRQ